MHQTEISYRPDIDILRAVAVTSVVLCHVDLGFSGGYVGVDVFFVISGYLITSLILKRIQRDQFSLTDFWCRRVRRILPALTVVTVLSTIAAALILLPKDFVSYGKSLVALSLSLSNFHFWRETDYFDGAADEKYLIHTWSLAVEEQFYLLLPLFLYVMARIKRLDRGFQLLGIVAVTSFALSVYGALYFPSGTFYVLPTRAWELFVGSLLARFPMKAPARHTRLAQELAAIFGLLLIAIPCAVYSKETPFPGMAALPPVLGAALVIWSGSLSESSPGTMRLLSARPIVFIGLISYSLYLWHWPLLAFARHLNVGPLSLPERMAIVAVSVLLATISWWLVERPFRANDLFGSRKATLAAAAVVLFAMLLSGQAITTGGGFPHRLSEDAQAYARQAELDQRFVFRLEASDIPDKIARFGHPDVTPQMLVWGDSHAMAMLPVIEHVCLQNGTAVCAATRSATVPALGYFHRAQIRRQRQTIGFNDAVFKFVTSSRIPTVLLIGNWHLYVDVPGHSLENALLSTVDALNAAGIRIYFMKDVPSYAFDVPSAMAQCYSDASKRSRLATDLQSYNKMNQLQEKLTAGLQARGVVILDPIPCLTSRGATGEQLMPGDAQGSYYRDKDHLSNYGAMRLASLFEPILGRPAETDGPTILADESSIRILPDVERKDRPGLNELTSLVSQPDLQSAPITEASIMAISFESVMTGSKLTRPLPLFDNPTKAAGYLNEQLRSPDLNLRLEAARSLQLLGPEAIIAIDNLIHALSDSDAELKMLSANALANIGPAASESLPALRNLASGSDLIAALTANWAIKRIEEAIPQTAGSNLPSMTR